MSCRHGKRAFLFCHNVWPSSFVTIMLGGADATVLTRFNTLDMGAPCWCNFAGYGCMRRRSQGGRGHSPQIFSISSLFCVFGSGVSNKNTVSRLKSNILLPPKVWVDYATGCMGRKIEVQEIVNKNFNFCHQFSTLKVAPMAHAMPAIP